MARVTVEDCVRVVPNRFELCLVANNRAKSISSGADTDLDRSEKPSVIALREIADELVDVDHIRDNIVHDIKTDSISNYNDYGNALDSDVMPSVGNTVLKNNMFVQDNLEVDD